MYWPVAMFLRLFIFAYVDIGSLLQLSAVLALKRLSMNSYMKFFADLPPLLFERCEVGEFVENVETLKSEFSKYRYLFVALVFDTASSVIRITVRSRIWCRINEGNSTERTAIANYMCKLLHAVVQISWKKLLFTRKVCKLHKIDVFVCTPLYIYYNQAHRKEIYRRSLPGCLGYPQQYYKPYLWFPCFVSHANMQAIQCVLASLNICNTITA